jgi:1-phosphofructokinase family hexose kinase
VTLPVIVCVSANPAVDRRLRFHSLVLGRVNRAKGVEAFPGGKAAHVAMAAHALGARTVWLGFLGGAIGEEFAAKLRELKIELVRVRTRKPTRMNLELLEDSGRITEVLEPGGRPDSTEMQEMLRAFAAGLRNKWRRALVVISGSLPLGVPADFYRSLIAAAESAGSRVILDTSGDALRASLASRPAFVKPNLEEAEALIGQKLKDQAAIVDAARELIDRGARSAAVSLGAEGLVWLEQSNGPAWFARPPRLRPISTVGCGDATVAGFALAIAKGMSGEAAIKLASACGAANCLAEAPGRISSKDVKLLMPRVNVHRIRCLGERLVFLNRSK